MKFKEKLGQLLSNNEEESALLLVEKYILNELHMKTLDTLLESCRALKNDLHQMQDLEECPATIRPAVETLIYSAIHSKVPGFRTVSKLLSLKYGKEFISKAQNNSGGYVNPVITQGIKPVPVNGDQRTAKLKQITAEQSIEYTPKLELPLKALQAEPQATAQIPVTREVQSKEEQEAESH